MTLHRRRAMPGGTAKTTWSRAMRQINFAAPLAMAERLHGEAARRGLPLATVVREKIERQLALEDVERQRFLQMLAQQQRTEAWFAQPWT